ncbi:MAG: AAA family ATPase [Xenococcaceae cyanobacterium]
MDINLKLDCCKAVYLPVPVVERLSILRWLVKDIGKAFDLPVYLSNLAFDGYRQLYVEEQRLITVDAIEFSDSDRSQHLVKALTTVCQSERAGIFIVENIGCMLGDRNQDLLAKELLKTWLINLVYQLRERENTYLILLDTGGVELDNSLSSIIPRVDIPLPTNFEIVELLRSCLASEWLNDETLNKLAVTAAGLTAEEIKLGLKLIRHQNIALDEEQLILALLDYKISRLQGLGLSFLPSPNVGDLGGLDLLKGALETVKADYSPLARQYNIPLPKGWLLAGPPGSGKSFAAKVCAQKLGIPLISIGVDVVKSGGAVVLRRLLDRVEAAAPAVCYFDEFDKFFMANNSAVEDSKTKEVLGLLLTWLQEKQSQTFVIATLNRLDALPPELTRVGRFDRVFYVGFPSAIERVEIIQLHASRFDRRYKQGNGPLDLSEWRTLLDETQNCIGAELSSIVEVAAKTRFYALANSEVELDDLHLELEDLLKARRAMTPLFVRDPERILAIENRAKYVAEPASSPDVSEYVIEVTGFWS